MTARINKSHLGDMTPDIFAARVKAHYQAKLDHHSTTDVPAPHEHDLVESCIRRVPQGDGKTDDYAIDYEIVDNSPAKTLREQKDDLIHKITLSERELMTASMAPGKRRLHGMDVHAIYQKAPSEHSEVDNGFLAEHASRIAREQIIQRHAAEQMAEVEDLTEETIGKWTPKPFPS